MGETGTTESSETLQAHTRESQEESQMEVEAGANGISASAESQAASEPMEVDSQVEVSADGARLHAIQQQQSEREGSSHDEEAKDDEQVVVNVKFLHRERVTLTCSSMIRVAELKERVREAYIDAVRQDQVNADGAQAHSEPDPSTQHLRLIYKGKVLKNDQTLESAHFASDDTIHAVFSRPSLTPSNAPPVANSDSILAQNNQGASNQASDNGGVDDTDGRSLFVFNLPDAATAVPDISRLITNIVSSAMNAADDGSGATATIRVMPMSPSSGPVTTTAVSETTNVSASVSSTPAVTTSHSATAAATHTTPPASVAVPSVLRPTSQPSGTFPSAATHNGGPNSSHTGSLGLLNQAAALRRSIPALELAPLSRPPELSAEMYNLGNAVRESCDTYLAVHRQLQFLSTRFLQENNLSQAERARLRARVLQLIPVMQRTANLSAIVAEQLSSSSYGRPHVQAAPVVPESGADLRPSGPVPVDPTAQVFRSFADIFQIPQGVPQSAANNTANQVISAIPNILSVVSALAAGTRGESQVTGNRTTGSRSTSPNNAPIRSLSSKLQALQFDESLTISEQLQRTIFSIIVAHVSECCSGGADGFVRSCVDETETALQQCLEADQTGYVRHESRISILRLAFQDLAQLCTNNGGDGAARLMKIRLWLRRACSHFYAELCELVPASRTAQLLRALLRYLFDGVGEATSHPSPLAEVFSALATDFLRQRFTVI